MRKVKLNTKTQPAARQTRKSRGSLPWAFSFRDAVAAIGHGIVTCVGSVPVTFVAAEQHVLHATFIAALGGAIGAVAKGVQRFFSDTRK